MLQLGATATRAVGYRGAVHRVGGLEAAVAVLSEDTRPKAGTQFMVRSSFKDSVSLRGALREKYREIVGRRQRAREGDAG